MLGGAGEESPIGGIFAKFSERVALNDAGAVVFTAVLKGAAAPQAIFAVEGGRTRKVVAIGDIAGDRGVFSHFGLWPALSCGGTVGFVGSCGGGAVVEAGMVWAAGST